CLESAIVAPLPKPAAWTDRSPSAWPIRRADEALILLSELQRRPSSRHDLHFALARRRADQAIAAGGQPRHFHSLDREYAIHAHREVPEGERDAALDVSAPDLEGAGSTREL